jgi:hypothetical protein
MTLEAYVRAQMARFAIEEAQRHGGINNMLAILHVLRNRVMAGWGDWAEVTLNAPDRRGTIYPPGDQPNLKANNVRIVLNRVDEIYTRTDLVDLTGNALFYMDSNMPVADWFKREVLDRPEDHPRCCHIGPVWFFK